MHSVSCIALKFAGSAGSMAPAPIVNDPGSLQSWYWTQQKPASGRIQTL